jgi:polyisoprenoid-binding protein YceI
MAWQFDPYHTQVGFSAKHLGMMTVRGLFTDITAGGHIDPDHPEASTVDITVATGSIKTHHDVRDNDLRSSNFLEAEQYPTMHFQSTSVETVDDNHFKLHGDLTIKSTTKPITLDVEKYGEFNDPHMGHRIAYRADTEIKRRDFGMTFNAVLDGKWVVSDDIKIEIEGELVEQPDAEAEAEQTATASE